MFPNGRVNIRAAANRKNKTTELRVGDMFREVNSHHQAKLTRELVI